MHRLSWDLHLHPAPSADPRWGDGLRLWQAALDAGVHGFVWKSHEEHTVERCHSLPPGPPVAIPSASLNSWATPDSVIGAVEAGARWIWGPSRDADGRLAWDIPLPGWWPELKAELAALSHPVVVATSHLDSKGRAELAAAAAELPLVHCTVTHSLYIPQDEADTLAGFECAFEFDLYTYIYPLPGRPTGDLVEQARRLVQRGVLVYIASDAGQAHVGNPFEFSGRVLTDLARGVGDDLVESLADENPSRFVRQVLPTEVHL